MAAQRPEELHREWSDRFNANDLDGLLQLYEDDARFLSEPGGDTVRGKNAIREVLNGFLAAGATFELQQTKALSAEELAIVYSKWTLKGGSDPDGSPLDIAAETTDVMRRQGDGSWLFVIDSPWGVGD